MQIVTNAIQQPRRNSSASYPLDTAGFAAINGVKSTSVRVRLCKTGSYFGVIPLKLCNRRLMWPAIQVAGEASK